MHRVLVRILWNINYYTALRKADVPAELNLHHLWGHLAMFLLGGNAENKGIVFLNHHNYVGPDHTKLQ